MRQVIWSESKLSRLFHALLVCSLLNVGCTPSDSTTADAPATEADPGSAADAQQQLVASDPVQAATAQQNADYPQAQFRPGDPTVFQPGNEAPTEPQPRQLRDDLSPAQLLDFLAAADKDMELIHSNRSGIEDPREAREALLQIVNMKLQASRQLVTHPAASAAAKSEGNRGELQSLSHLAALSDVQAAKELEQLANENMSSDDPRLVADSHLVLIGFAIEALQNGKAEAAEKIVTYIDQIASSGSAADVPALVVMGQGKQMLEDYGYAELAKRVRDTIISTFGDSENPDVAAMAAQIAGNVLFDGVDQIRGQILDGDAITVPQWTQSVETLISESADLQTVRYLAGAAVDFEANGLQPFAEATLKTLAQNFQQPDAATTSEVQTAIAATEARQRIIGQEFDPNLPGIDGNSLSLKAYRGKVVLIPFWGMGIPLSLQPIPILQSLQQENPDKIAIVGVNLDPADAPLSQFVQENQIGFPSYSLVADPASQIPMEFGVVSMPFVAIVDTEGKVAAIQLSDKNLQSTVQGLME